MEDQALIELYWNRNEDAIAQTHQKYGVWCRGIAFDLFRPQTRLGIFLADGRFLYLLAGHTYGYL